MHFEKLAITTQSSNGIAAWRQRTFVSSPWTKACGVIIEYGDDEEKQRPTVAGGVGGKKKRRLDFVGSARVRQFRFTKPGDYINTKNAQRKYTAATAVHGASSGDHTIVLGGRTRVGVPKAHRFDAEQRFRAEWELRALRYLVVCRQQCASRSAARAYGKTEVSLAEK